MAWRLLAVLASHAAALQGGPVRRVTLVELEGGTLAGTSVPLRNIHDLSQKSRHGWKSVHRTMEMVPIYTDGQGFRQRIENRFDMQYVMNFTLGSQTVAGLPDTGSYDLVVVTKDCKSCGAGTPYDPSLSSLHRPTGGNAWKYYGSGALLTKGGYDVLDVGPYKGINASVCEVTEAKMQLLQDSDFTAIIGLGPAEPQYKRQSAWDAARKQWYSEFSRLSDKHTPVLQSIKERMFSVCIGKDIGSDGFIVWNDTSAVRHPELFHRVPVATTRSWTVEVRNIRLSYLSMLDAAPFFQKPLNWTTTQNDQGESEVFEQSTSIGLDCEKTGCNVLLDSGASVLAMPSSVVTKLQRVIGPSQADCSNMLELPHIVFEIGGKTFSLAPDAYMVETVAEPSSRSSASGVTGRKQKGGRDCGVSYPSTRVFSSDSWVFGLPFFRKYYTSFEVAPHARQRAVHIAGASEHCTPIKSRVQVHDGPPDMWRRTVNMDSARLLHWDTAADAAVDMAIDMAAANL